MMIRKRHLFGVISVDLAKTLYCHAVWASTLCEHGTRSEAGGDQGHRE